VDNGKGKYLVYLWRGEGREGSHQRVHIGGPTHGLNNGDTFGKNISGLPSSHRLSLLVGSQAWILHCKEPIPKTRKKYSQKMSCAATVPICERFIYSHHRSAYSASGYMWSVDRYWEYINRSQTHECGECGDRNWGCAIPWKGIHKRDFRCSVLYCISYDRGRNRFLGSLNVKKFELRARICRPFKEPSYRFPDWRAGTQLARQVT
jgi:hypothetical protein